MNCLIFPGLNGLIKHRDRNRFLKLPEVIDRLKEAESHIKETFDEEHDLLKVLTSPTEEIYSLDNIALACVIICSIQVGVVDALKNKNVHFKVLLGCSLGDLSRNICGGSYTFKSAISSCIRYAKAWKGIDEVGANIAIHSPLGDFTESDYLHFEDLEIDVSRLTSKFLNIGGRFKDLEKVRSLAKERNWTTKLIINYPAHSRHIKPYIDRLATQIMTEVQDVKPPIYKMYSSLKYREIKDPEEIKKQFLDCVSSPIHWEKSVKAVVELEKITTFINIGPCRSLSILMKDIDSNIQTLEASSLVLGGRHKTSS